MKIKLENISQMYDQDTWVSMGKPESYEVGFTDGYGKDILGNVFDVRIRGDEIFVRGKVDKSSSTEIEVQPVQTDVDALPPEFKFSDWVIDQPEKLLPSFTIDGEGSIPMIFYAGVGPKPDAYFMFEGDNDVRKRVRFRTRLLNAQITIDGWIDLFDQQDVAPIIVRCSYGTVASERVLNKQFGSLKMFTGEKPVIDFFRAKGLIETFYRTDILQWETEIVSPRLWWKARTIEVFGALLCMPDYSKLGDYVNRPDFQHRMNTLKAREEGPMVGFADIWDGHWLATKNIPQEVYIDDNFIWNKYVNRIKNYGDEYNERDYAQPQYSGQTGAQPDFGISRGELVVSQKLAFMLHDYRFSVQAWMLRPYSHKEADGNPITKANHPSTLLYNLSIDTRFGTDFLGFPNPVPYNQFWTGSDGQHRTDNLLYAMYALTRDPSIKATIEDLVQCSLMELKTWRLYGMPQSIEAPRGWGRPLLSMAHAVSLGFKELLPDLNEMVDVMHSCASMYKIPQTPDRTVRTLSNNGFKYGWLDSQGKQIRAWVCWEESIAAIGLWAAYKVTGNRKALDLAIEIGRTLTKHAFFKSGSTWYACYCVRWDTNNPGLPLPASSYNLDPNNKDVVVYGMQQWMLASLMIYVMNGTDTNDIARAKEILRFFNLPKNYDDSAWLAV